MFSKIQEIENDLTNWRASWLGLKSSGAETYQKYMKEHKNLAPIVEAFQEVPDSSARNREQSLHLG